MNVTHNLVDRDQLWSFQNKQQIRNRRSILNGKLTHTPGPEQTLIQIYFILINDFSMISSNSSCLQSQLESPFRKAITLITHNNRSSHIIDLLQLFDAHSINAYTQIGTQSLGTSLKERNFVVVDNKDGKVLLGSQFSSLSMFIVGYPRKGPNKKNHYCRTPEEVIQKYYMFCQLEEYGKQSLKCSALKIIHEEESAKSIFLDPNRGSTSNLMNSNTRIKGPNSLLKKVNSQSKLFLYLKSDNKTLRKYIFRISACNPIKFSVVEDIEDLEVGLAATRTRENYVLVEIEYLSEILKIQANKFKALVFNPEGKEFEKSQRINQQITSYSDIIKSLRNLGFSIVSIKDLEKSIVKYDNPFTKSGSRSQKKLSWVPEDNQQQQQKQIPKSELKEEVQEEIQQSQSQLKETSPEIIKKKRTIKKIKGKNKENQFQEFSRMKTLQKNKCLVSQEYCLKIEGNSPQKQRNDKGTQKQNDRKKLLLPRVSVKLNKYKKIRAQTIDPIFQKIKERKPVKAERKFSHIETISHQQQNEKKPQIQVFNFPTFSAIKSRQIFIFYKEFNYQIDVVCGKLKEKYPQIEKKYSFSSPFELKSQIKMALNRNYEAYAIFIFDDLGLNKFYKIICQQKQLWLKSLILILPKFSSQKEFQRNCFNLQEQNASLDQMIVTVRNQEESLSQALLKIDKMRD